jgi:hypothetical protein
MRQRDKPKLIQVFQYDFPDAATFDGNLLDSDQPINEYMENYSELVLLLFTPYHAKHDLMLQRFLYNETRLHNLSSAAD